MGITKTIAKHTTNWLQNHPQCKKFWKTYVVERKVLHGLPAALLVTAAFAKHFDCTTFRAAALFATVNYTLLTSATELMRKHAVNHPAADAGVIVVGGIVSAVATRVFPDKILTNKNCLILTLAALSGHAFRAFVCKEEE